MIIEHYRGHMPALDIRRYLSGEVEAWGVFIDRRGEAEPRFHAQMQGEWRGDEGTLSERFTYSDGRQDQRVWTVRFTGDHHFTGTAHDVVGVARGRQYGNAAHLQYKLRVSVKGKTYTIAMDDWMFLVDEHNLINRITMRKFGFKVGELVIAFRKNPHA